MVDNVKMEVTPDLSRRVQEIVFANGGSWISGDAEVKYLDDIRFLYLKENCLVYDKEINRDTFIQSPREEISAYDFIASQGMEKWLPRFGEEVECSDDGIEWAKLKFASYIPENELHFLTTSYKLGYKYCRPLQKKKTIVIDGKNIEISEESFNELKKQLLSE